MQNVSKHQETEPRVFRSMFYDHHDGLWIHFAAYSYHRAQEYIFLQFRCTEPLDEADGYFHEGEVFRISHMLSDVSMRLKIMSHLQNRSSISRSLEV